MKFGMIIDNVLLHSSLNIFINITKKRKDKATLAFDCKFNKMADRIWH